MNEIWKDIEGYEGLYQVSNMGNVKSLNYNKTGQERIRRLTPDTNGYLQIILHKDGKIKPYKIHRLVAQTFILNPNNKPCIDHINAIKTDNRVDNLRWVTYKENNDNPLTKERLNQKVAKRVFCDGVIYSSGGQCAKHYNVPKTTMNHWLTGVRKMPADFQEKGLRYYIEE